MLSVDAASDLDIYILKLTTCKIDKALKATKVISSARNGGTDLCIKCNTVSDAVFRDVSHAQWSNEQGIRYGVKHTTSITCPKA